jgi:peptide-methionine (R)-S-oxide reductase
VHVASTSRPTRRHAIWVTAAAIGAAGLLWWRKGGDSSALVAYRDSTDEVTVVEFSNSGARQGPAQFRKVVRSESDWRSRLTPQQYYVTRRHSTDDPFTGTYYRMHEAGLYRCVCCDNALFSSETKYDSGTGWPAFWAPIASENVRPVETPGLSRHDALQVGIEVLCTRCDAHLGHIFDDGPEPTNLRYCINESSLRFIPKA